MHENFLVLKVVWLMINRECLCCAMDSIMHLLCISVNVIRNDTYTYQNSDIECKVHVSTCSRLFSSTKKYVLNMKVYQPLCLN